MYLERLLQINMATLAALGALLLGMGQRSEGPPLLVALAAVVSVWLTDVTRRFCLGRRTANVLMLLAAAVALRDVFPLGSELQAFALAWLLIYLQIILLFQPKDERTYWLLVDAQPVAGGGGHAVQPGHVVRSAAGGLHAVGLFGHDAAADVSPVGASSAGGRSGLGRIRNAAIGAFKCGRAGR